jgi:glutathione S-transferase
MVLEELGLHYKVMFVPARDFKKGQTEPKIPNGRFPAIEDPNSALVSLI